MSWTVRAACVGLLAVAGCGESGPPVGDVSGRVTYKGAPVTEGAVSFYSEKANYGADAKLDGDGRFRFQTAEGGLLLGEYKISVMPPIEYDSSDPRTPPVAVMKDLPNIPKKYRDASTTPLKETVKEGKNEFNLELQ